MTMLSKNNLVSFLAASLRSEADLRGGPESPTKLGIYWFLPETLTKALMVEVRVTNGELTVWWPNQDKPVANLKGKWRGPIPTSSVPSSH
jgi:hypothetical protein